MEKMEYRYGKRNISVPELEAEISRKEGDVERIKRYIESICRSIKHFKQSPEYKVYLNEWKIKNKIEYDITRSAEDVKYAKNISNSIDIFKQSYSYKNYRNDCSILRKEKKDNSYNNAFGELCILKHELIYIKSENYDKNVSLYDIAHTYFFNNLMLYPLHPSLYDLLNHATEKKIIQMCKILLAKDGGFIKFKGNVGCRPECKGWDGVCRYCNCGHNRVAWRTYDVTFLNDDGELYAESYKIINGKKVGRI